MARPRRQRRFSSTSKRNSRYVQGGRTTVHPTRLGFWERNVVLQRDDDIFTTVTKRQDRRPDLIAFDFYGKQELGWLVLQYNNIVDLNLQLLEGTEIRLPIADRVFFDLLNSPTGGFPPPAT